jgi:Acetyl-coenzyme A synthetase N-terminus
MASTESASSTKRMGAAAQIDDEHIIPTIVPPIPTNPTSTKAIARNVEEYKERHLFSITEPNKFWFQQATERISWFDFPFHENSNVCQGSFKNGDVSWFANAKLNVCYNAVDRHVADGKGNKVAMIWEGDEVNEIRHITFHDMQCKISQICHVLEGHGVTKGSVVTIYMPMSKSTKFSLNRSKNAPCSN